MTMTFGSLFSGIGGMDLGLERAGMVCKFQVEIDPYCQRVLKKHWPDVPKYGDIREVTGEGLEPVDLICGGFPCQDISNAGKRAGIDGERSGLWSEYVRLIRMVRPRYVLVENVAALRNRGLDRVLGDLAASGYDAEWDCLPAAAVGAPHRRDRLFVVAYAKVGRRHDASTSQAGEYQERQSTRAVGGCGIAESDVADPDDAGLAVRACFGGNAREELAAFERSCRTGGGIWESEPPVGRVVDGAAGRVDRLRGLGNAVVPQVAEFIGKRIVALALPA